MFLQEKQKSLSISAMLLAVVFTMASFLVGFGAFIPNENNVALADNIYEDLFFANSGYSFFDGYLEPEVTNTGLLSVEPYSALRAELSFYFEIDFIYKHSSNGNRVLGSTSVENAMTAPVITIDPDNTLRIVLPVNYYETNPYRTITYYVNNKLGSPYKLVDGDRYKFTFTSVPDQPYFELIHFNELGEKLPEKGYTEFNYSDHYPCIYEGSPVVGYNYQAWGTGVRNSCLIKPNIVFGYIYSKGDYTFVRSSYPTIINNYAEAFNNGYDRGYSIGQDSGFDSGYSSGYDRGVLDGGTASYQDGLSDKKSTFDGFISVIESPFKMLVDIFNFEIFGINVSALVAFLLTIGLLVFVLKGLRG